MFIYPALYISHMFKEQYKNILAATLLNRLFQRGKWKVAHMPMDKVQHGVPSHLRGDAKKIMLSLIKSGLILSKSTFYGAEISLNTKKKKEILEIINKYL